MQDLIVTDTVIRRDDAGRFCLNDLHQAAGGEGRHEPEKFTRLDSTRELIAEVERMGFNSSDSRFNSPDLANKNSDDNPDHSAVIVQNRGRYGGSYAVKLLAYAYAMWISPAFQIKVIQAYDRTVQERREGAAAPAQLDMFTVSNERYRLVGLIRAEPSAQVRQMIYHDLVASCRLSGATVPPLGELEATAPATPARRPRQHQPQVAETFWRAVAALEGRKANIDHSRDPGRVAYNLPQIRTVAQAMKVPLPASRRELRDALYAHPRFVGVIPVNSALTGHTVKCWVFARDTAKGVTNRYPLATS